MTDHVPFKSKKEGTGSLTCCWPFTCYCYMLAAFFVEFIDVFVNSYEFRKGILSWSFADNAYAVNTSAFHFVSTAFVLLTM